MPQESQQRLDVLFPFEDAALVQAGLRSLVKLVEGRLGALEGQRTDLKSVIDELTEVALYRINDVLLPALPILDEIIRAGFGADRILDSGIVGRAVIRSNTQAEFLQATGAALATTADATAANLANLTSRVDAIQGGADPALDTFLEISTRLAADAGALATLMNALSLRLRFDAAQFLTAGQKAQGLLNLGAQAALGFTPARQTGDNVITLDYNGFGPQILVDATDFGTIWCEVLTTINTNDAGILKLPNGFIFQWNRLLVGANPYVTFPVTFPNRCLHIAPTLHWDAGATEIFGINIGDDTTQGFTARIRRTSAIGVTSEPGAIQLRYMAIGF